MCLLPLAPVLTPHRSPPDANHQCEPFTPATRYEKSGLELIQAQLAKLPTRRELAQTALLATLTGAALVLLGILAFGQL